jgi:hypothetical protein
LRSIAPVVHQFHFERRRFLTIVVHPRTMQTSPKIIITPKTGKSTYTARKVASMAYLEQFAHAIYRAEINAVRTTTQQLLRH